MRVTELEDPGDSAGSNLTAAEEEELLYGSDKEGEPDEAHGVGEPGKVGGGKMEVDEEMAGRKGPDGAGRKGPDGAAATEKNLERQQPRPERPLQAVRQLPPWRQPFHC